MVYKGQILAILAFFKFSGVIHVIMAILGSSVIKLINFTQLQYILSCACVVAKIKKP